MVANRTLNELKSFANTLKNQAKLLEEAVKDWSRNRSHEMTLQSKTRNFWQLDHLHLVLIAMEQIILQKKTGAFPMPLIDPIGWNTTIQQTIGMKGKNKAIWPNQDLYQLSRTL